jgi:hypothetical protein
MYVSLGGMKMKNVFLILQMAGVVGCGIIALTIEMLRPIAIVFLVAWAGVGIFGIQQLVWGVESKSKNRSLVL